MSERTVTRASMALLMLIVAGCAAPASAPPSDGADPSGASCTFPCARELWREEPPKLIPNVALLTDPSKPELRVIHANVAFCRDDEAALPCMTFMNTRPDTNAYYARVLVSTNAGATFTPATFAAEDRWATPKDAARLDFTGGYNGHGSVATLLGNGEILVAGTRTYPALNGQVVHSEEIRVAKSSDGGKTFAASRVVHQGNVAHLASKGLAADNGYGIFSIDAWDERVLLCWSTRVVEPASGGGGDIKECATSPDRGETWSAPIEVVRETPLAYGLLPAAPAEPARNGLHARVLVDAVIVGVTVASHPKLVSSRDGGATWTTEDLPAAGELVALSAEPEETLAVVATPSDTVATLTLLVRERDSAWAVHELTSRADAAPPRATVALAGGTIAVAWHETPTSGRVILVQADGTEVAHELAEDEGAAPALVSVSEQIDFLRARWTADGAALIVSTLHGR